MKKHAIILIITAAVIVAMNLLTEKEVAVFVETTTVSRRDITRTVEANGELRALKTRSLGVATYAVVDKIYVNVGDMVKEGQVLMTFSSNDTPTVEGLQDLLTSAGADALSGDTSGLIAGSIAASEIVSPFDGIVTSIGIREGEQASPLIPCITINDTSRMLAVIRLNESDASSVTPGMPATVRSDSNGFSGVVTEISPVIKTTASLTGSGERYCEAVIELYRTDGAISGAAAQAVISTSRREGALTIPYDAVGQDNSVREYVYLVRDGRVFKQYIYTGEEFDLTLEVLGGIQAGDRVVTSSHAGLEDGMAVEVTR